MLRGVAGVLMTSLIAVVKYLTRNSRMEEVALSYSSRQTVLAGGHKAGARRSERYSECICSREAERENVVCSSHSLYIQSGPATDGMCLLHIRWDFPL